MSNGDEENSYEALRLANIARNKALLESLGLDEFRIPDAPPKPSKSSKNKTKPPPSKKRKTETPATNGGNGSGDETVVESEDTRERHLSTRQKRPTIRSNSSQDTLVEGGARRSSRNIRRVSYANGGVHILAQRNRRSKSEEAGEEYVNESDADDSEDDFDNDADDEEKPNNASNKKRRRGSGKNSGRKSRDGSTKLRRVAKMGNRKHDPYVSGFNWRITNENHVFAGRKQHGSIPGVAVGTWYETRALCSMAAVHG